MYKSAFNQCVRWRLHYLLALILVVQALPVQTVRADHIPITQFDPVAERGFGDRQNSWAWSMQWWNGWLYVGTNRAWNCVVRAAYAQLFPELLRYRSDTPDIECAATPQDLPLQAEIWRYAPAENLWERVYQSPNDIEIPDYPDKHVARDIGFRYMTVFTEADGTEALYVAGVNAQAIHPGVPPPRLLRSTDGENFEAVPQDPGTFLGDLGEFQGSIRTLTSYKDRFYMVVGYLFGSGMLLEAEDPAGGNDNFRQVTPAEMQVFEAVTFNGYLYLGLSDPENGYAVVKTDASGDPPYEFIPVVTEGGYRQPRASGSVLSMHLFDDHLYVGTDRPAELIRIHPDDSWDLLVGLARETPDGMKSPLSGMGDGFDFPLNMHIWRMQEHDGLLYIGTANFSTALRRMPVLGDILAPSMGFALYATRDGVNYYTITRNGFGDKFEAGLRTFASTPLGLFMGTANPYYGLQIFHGEATLHEHTYVPTMVVNTQ